MNDRYESDEFSPDLEAFQDWVRRTAESEGTSPESVVQQLMSTYWILKELTETLEETSSDHFLVHELDEEGRDAPEPSQNEGDTSGAARSEIVDVIEAIAKLNQPRAEEPERMSGAFDSGLVDLVGAIRQQPGTGANQSAAPSVGQLERLRERVTSVSRDVEDVEERIEAVREETERGVEGNTDRIAVVEDATDDLESRLGSIADRYETELSNLDGALRELESTLEGKADAEALADLESTTNQEFDAIERAFERLLDAIDDTESELESSIESSARDIDQFRKHLEKRQRLAELKHEAMRRGVEKAVCENCSQSIEFGLLAAPYCPNCDRTLANIETGGWNPFRRARITTEPVRSVATTDAEDPEP